MKGGAEDTIYTQRAQACNGTDDVDERVGAAYLVQSHRLDVCAVDGRFSFGQSTVDPNRIVLDLRIE
jgi:hypothetical protein